MRPTGGAGGRQIQRPFEFGRDSIPLVLNCQGALKVRTIDDLLDRAKEATKSRNDSELAKHLGIKPAAVSNYRREVSLPNAVVCATLAGLTGEPLARVLGIVGEARAISSDEKAVWRRLATSAASLMMAIGIISPSTSHALNQAKKQLDNGDDKEVTAITYRKLKLWVKFVRSILTRTPRHQNRAKFHA